MLARTVSKTSVETNTPKVYFFDKVDTLTESRSSIGTEMALLLESLIKQKIVAITSGSSIEKINDHVVSHLSLDKDMSSRLYLFPDAGASHYRLGPEGNLIQIYSYPLRDGHLIKNALWQLIDDMKLSDESQYGSRIEAREAAVTFCGLGEHAPHDLKLKWDPTRQKREMMKEKLDNLFPDYDVVIAGTSSLNITQKGINKSFAVYFLAEHLSITPQEMVFVGDSFFDDGQDCLVCKTGVQTVVVSGVQDTKEFIKNTLALLEGRV